MKTSWLLPGLLVLMPSTVILLSEPAQAQTATNASGYVIVERGLDYRIWQATNADSNGNVGQYIELASGLNFTNSSGQWVDAMEQINILPTGGAAATQGRHQVYFPGDIYTGVIQVVTPDGRHLSHRPVGVSYDDGSNSVWIAKLKDCTGYLVGSNQVVYPDAFTGVKADLVCTYRRGGFENDLVFRQSPPSPDAYGLDPSAAVLQLFTEFFNTQDPQQIPAADDPDYGLTDAELKFGQLTMTHGKAFIAGQQTTNAVDVYKSWFHAEGRTFLVEQLPLDYVAPELDTLPPSTNILTSQIQSKDSILYVARAKRQFPPARGISHDKTPMLVAALDLTKQPGVILDYVTVNSGQNNYSFYAGQTYFISGSLSLSGTTTIQGGAVIKFDGAAGHMDQQGSSLQLSGPLTCTLGSYQPAVLTDKNDNTVGETISGSSGTPR